MLVKLVCSCAIRVARSAITWFLARLMFACVLPPGITAAAPATPTVPMSRVDGELM